METVSTPKLNNSNIIRSVSSNQREILYNIMQLHNNGEPFDCDITASSLNFYNKSKTDKFNIPEPKYLFDVYPQFDKVTKITPFQNYHLKIIQLVQLLLIYLSLFHQKHAKVCLKIKRFSNNSKKICIILPCC